jgi:hypothetical protein
MEKKREIWFRRTFLWGGTPTHWKGVLVVLIGVGVGLVGGNGAMSFNHPVIGAIIIVGAVVWTFVVAERHTE